MAGKVIGKTLPFGFRGNPSQNPDTLIEPFVNTGDDNIEFGEPVVFDPTTKGVRKIKSTDSSGTNIIGIAVRHIGQPYADSPDGYYYKKHDMVDVLIRGGIMVELAATTGIAARGNVYVRNGANQNNAAGGIVCQAATGAGADTVQIPNAVFTIGEYDANNIAEIVILSRSI